MSNMRAVVIYEIGGPEKLILEKRAIPQAKTGEVLIQIKAFGLNRSEMFTRWGHSKKVVQFPRVLGIECVGVVESCPSGNFSVGQQVAAIMGGLGRKFDGGYAEYTCVPEDIVIPFQSNLPWEVIGAVPEMCQTANGSLELSLELKPGETLLIRGGTSSVGMTAAQLASIKGCTVLSTTRNPNKVEALLKQGVHKVYMDNGTIADQVRKDYPEGIDKVLELIGPTSLIDSMNCVRSQGIVCQTGYLGNQWAFENFSPLGQIPSTVRLTSYAGENNNLAPELLDEFLQYIADGRLKLSIDRVFKLDEIVAAHTYMEENKAKGKLVVVNQ